MAFQNSYVALQEYDSSMEERARAWKDARTMDELRLAELKDTLALRNVQYAFMQDAKAMNSVPDNFKDVSILFIRDCVRRFHGYEGPEHEHKKEKQLRQGYSLVR